MADIDVVKKGSSSWLWIVIALIVLAVILWFVMGRNSAPQTGLHLEQGTPALTLAPAALHT
jgi:bacteriorhodopsin